jgi:hypothetical protein
MYDIVVDLDVIFAENVDEALKIARNTLREGEMSLDVAYESDELDE